jgi:hypothetical protein
VNKFNKSVMKNVDKFLLYLTQFQVLGTYLQSENAKMVSLCTIFTRMFGI